MRPSDITDGIGDDLMPLSESDKQASMRPSDITDGILTTVHRQQDGSRIRASMRPSDITDGITDLVLPFVRRMVPLQ